MASTNPQTEKWHKACIRNREIIAQAKNVPCYDCGGRFPTVCMDFDHVIGTKGGNIARLGTSSVERLRAEIAKCDVICANCHRIRSEQREQHAPRTHGGGPTKGTVYPRL